MAKINGTVVISSIVPTDSNDLYSTHNEEYGQGGYRTVATIMDRDNIPDPRRKTGMVVYVEDGGDEYRLVGGISNSDWVKLNNSLEVDGENVKSTNVSKGKVLTSDGRGWSEWTTPTGGASGDVEGADLKATGTIKGDILVATDNETVEWIPNPNVEFFDGEEPLHAKAGDLWYNPETSSIFLRKSHTETYEWLRIFTYGNPGGMMFIWDDANDRMSEATEHLPIGVRGFQKDTFTVYEYDAFVWTALFSTSGSGGIGKDGLSAYELYVKNLPEGDTPLSEIEWLNSLKGENGKDGVDGKDLTSELNTISDKVEAKDVEAGKVLTSRGDGTSEWITPTGGGSSGGLNPDENIELSAGKGVIMTSENGTKYKLYIDNDGRITTEVL